MKIKINKDLQTIYFFSSLCSLLLIVLFGVCEIYDSFSYVDAWQSLSLGHLDALRTPVYPIFLHFLSILFGLRYYLLAAICIQHLFFLLSLGYLFRLVDSFCHSHNLAFWLTLVYGTLPAINSWNNCILTESLAMSGSVFLLYMVFKTSDNPSVINATITTSLILFLIFLRPIFIYILPVLLLYTIAFSFRRKRKEKNVSLYLGASIIISSLCFFFYMNEYKKEYGVFATSNVSIINQYYMARQYNLIDPSDISDPKLRADIERWFIKHGERVDDMSLIWEEAKEVTARHSLSVIQENLSSMAKKNVIGTLRSMKDRLVRSAQKPFLFSPIWRISICFYIFGASLNTLYLFLLIYTFFLMYWIKLHKSFPWNPFLLYMLGISNIIVAVVGAQDEWGRLILPSMPIWFIVIGQVCGSFNSIGQGYRYCPAP